MSATSTTTNSSAPLATSDKEADCERVNIVLDQLLEGRALSEADEDYLVDHADDCSPCFDDIKKQKFFIGFLKDKVNRRSAPSALNSTILERVHAEMA
ncbi:MAG: hypothetical protein ACRYFX_02720 [Janthinobacterium lividum]